MNAVYVKGTILLVLDVATRKPVTIIPMQLSLMIAFVSTAKKTLIAMETAL